jgi:hypothetical protein
LTQNCSNCAYVLAGENDEYFCLSDNSCCSIPKSSVLKQDNHCRNWKAGVSIATETPMEKQLNIEKPKPIKKQKNTTQIKTLDEHKVQPTKPIKEDEISFRAGGGWLIAAFALGGDIMFILFLVFGLLRW